MLLNFSGICNLFYLCPFIDFKFFFKSHLILTYSSGKDGVYPWVQQDKGLNKVDLIFKVVFSNWAKTIRWEYRVLNYYDMRHEI